MTSHNIYYPTTFIPTAYENIEVTTKSHPEAFPSVLREKRKTQTISDQGLETRLKVALFNIMTHIASIDK